ncbi:class I adenylate-forming enzyme family protein [Hazenella coriacea]|uniref:Acyl-CoA synthetase (AMP-forming)/AMP-acid ligase II n=1 Tax=Hazenella coriacea TaxID=1179467 RepID=A0A4R3L3Q0_9BACL|nr:class I adenylate-forming enzyme family protein [Hazenella coriacea]TCS92384.1 acyl-CoA synthetase (AMP-forming)/AMP-acid ligase II [Hazenella coriacea]
MKSGRIILSNSSYSTHDLLLAISRTTQRLKERGVSEHDRVLFQCSNSFEFIVNFFSLIQLNASIVIIDSQITEEEVLHTYFPDSQAKWIITDRLTESAPHLIFIHEVNSSDCQDENELVPFLMDQWVKKEDAIILYSSGSTGKPKGIVRSGRSFIENIKQTMERMNYHNDDVFLPLLPFSHFYGLSLLFIWWFTQCSIVITHDRYPGKILKAIFDHQVTIVDAAPSSYYSMIKVFQARPALLEQYRNSEVRMWCVGGAALTEKLAQDFQRQMGQPLLDGYGMSELGNIALATGSNPVGCGQPLPGVMIKILDRNGLEKSLGEVGMIWVRSTARMSGYLHQKELTQQKFINHWFDTGDLGFLDENANLFVIGRAGQAVNRMGYLIEPAQLEQRVESLGYVNKVITLEDDKKGSLIAIFIENPRNKEISVIRKEIIKSIPNYMYPDLLMLLNQFPLNRNGKVDLLRLKEIAKQELLERRTMKEELIYD